MVGHIFSIARDPGFDPPNGGGRGKESWQGKKTNTKQENKTFSCSRVRKLSSTLKMSREPTTQVFSSENKGLVSHPSLTSFLALALRKH